MPLICAFEKTLQIIKFTAILSTKLGDLNAETELNAEISNAESG